jgi:hypothetical protein
MGSLKDLLQNHWTNYPDVTQITLGGGWDSNLFPEGDSPYPRGDNSERVKYSENF